MKVILNVTVGPGGRLAGSVGTPAHPNQHAFGGAMELIAHIERLCCQAEPPARNGAGTETKELADGDGLL
jgi:hypothetical protein